MHMLSVVTAFHCKTDLCIWFIVTTYEWTCIEMKVCVCSLNGRNDPWTRLLGRVNLKKYDCVKCSVTMCNWLL